MKVKTLELFGFIGVLAIGIFLYFAYDFFDQSKFVAMIAPVNESIWEQLKIPFYSVLLYGIVVYLFAKGEHRNILFAKVISAVITSVFSLMMYFGYTSIFDDHILLNLMVYFVAIVIGQFFSLGVLNIKSHFSGYNFIGLLVLVTMLLTFATYTHQPPNHDLFKDPKTQQSGI